MLDDILTGEERVKILSGSFFGPMPVGKYDVDSDEVIEETVHNESIDDVTEDKKSSLKSRISYLAKDYVDEVKNFLPYFRDAYFSKKYKKERKEHREKIATEVLVKNLNYFKINANIIKKFVPLPMKNIPKRFISGGLALVAGGFTRKFYETASVVSGIQNFDDAAKSDFMMNKLMLIPSTIQFTLGYTAAVVSVDSVMQTVFGAEMPREVYNFPAVYVALGFGATKYAVTKGREWTYKKYKKFVLDPLLLIVPSTAIPSTIAIVGTVFGKGIDVTKMGYDKVMNGFSRNGKNGFQKPYKSDSNSNGNVA